MPSLFFREPVTRTVVGAVGFVVTNLIRFSLPINDGYINASLTLASAYFITSFLHGGAELLDNWSG